MKIKDILKKCGGKFIGKEDYEVEKLSPLNQADEKSIVFYRGDRKEDIENSKAGLIIAKIEVENKNLIITDNPEDYWNCIINNFFPHLKVDYREGNYFKGENTTIGKGTKIGWGSYIGDNVKIGENCLIYPGVKIMDRVYIGNHVVIHSGVVIGSPGFGFFKKEGKFVRREQIGSVIIEDNVEIGANTVIDRGSVEDTIIGENTKIDALCMIGHGVKIGKNCIIVGQTAIAGSTRIGNNVLISGQVSIIDHLEICDNVVLLADTGVYKSINEPGVYAGKPARKREEYWRAIARLYREAKTKK